MANRLIDIFSDDVEEYLSTLRFKDNDAYRNFRAALDAVEKDGSVMKVDGIESVSLFLQHHGIKVPLEQHNDISHFVIGPAIEQVDFQVSWAEGEKVYKFRRYRINDGIVLETKKDAIVYLKLIFSESSQKVRITYHIQYQHAKSIGEIAHELKACVCFLSKFHASVEQSGTSAETNKIDEILQFLQYTEKFVLRLSAVEKELNLSFAPHLLNNLSSEDHQDVEELYLLLCKRIPLRLNAKLTSTEATNITVSGEQKKLSIGTKIAIVFVRDVSYQLFGQQFTIYTANAVINAIIKDFQKIDSDTTVYYGDTDSQPMYISYTAYLKEDEAKKEAEKNIGAEEEYVNALTVVEHMKKNFEEIAY